MEEKTSLTRKAAKYFILLLSNFFFFVVTVLAISYFHPLMRALVWPKNFALLLSILIVSAILWVVTFLAHLFMK
ncbi:MAG: hypothetical protein AB1756_09865 [Acidobacteriota bacterium]